MGKQHGEEIARVVVFEVLPNKSCTESRACCISCCCFHSSSLRHRWRMDALVIPTFCSEGDLSIGISCAHTVQPDVSQRGLEEPRAQTLASGSTNLERRYFHQDVAARTVETIAVRR
jgi:hypothetical protein